MPSNNSLLEKSENVTDNAYEHTILNLKLKVCYISNLCQHSFFSGIFQSPYQSSEIQNHIVDLFFTSFLSTYGQYGFDVSAVILN